MEKTKNAKTNAVEDLNLESKIRNETADEMIAFLKDHMWRMNVTAQMMPCKKKKDQEAVLNRNAGFNLAIELLARYYTDGGRFTTEKFTAEK